MTDFQNFNDTDGADSVNIADPTIPTQKAAVDSSGRVSVAVNNIPAVSQSGTWTVQQGNTPTAIANAWPFKLTDGTNTTAVKAASTAPVATDPAAVVALSPNGNQATSANQTTQITALQLIDNPVGSSTGGVAGTSSFMMGGLFNTALPTLTNGQQASIQLDSSGRVIIAPLTNTSVVKAQLQDNAGTAITLGQKSMAGSVPVVLPTDQTLTVVNSPLPVSGSKFSFGVVTTAAANTLAVVEKTTYTEPTTNGQRSFASSNAGDAAAGTGARTLLLTYYDQTCAGPFTETITLNGTSRVNTVATNICFIESIVVLTAGSNGSNLGTITMFTLPTAGGTTIATIAVGDNQTFWAHHYVAAGGTCYISGFSVNNTSTAVGNGGSFQLRSRNPTIATSINKQISDFHRLYGQSSTTTRTYQSPIQIIGPALIRAYVSPESNTSVEQRASFDYIDA